MPIGIGTAAALTAGAAVIGAGATIYASGQSSKAQTKAADQASQVAQTTAADNNQLARDMYASNAARLDPYSSMGLAAGDEYTGLLLGPQSTHTGSGWAPTNALATATPAAGGSAPASGYSGPSLQQILNGGTQQQMDAYLGYYQAHPSEDPGFTTISPFHGDPFVDESSAGSVLAAHSAYQTAHPTAPAAPGNAIAPVVAQQAQQAIAAGADPAAVQARAMQYGVHL